MTRKQLLLLLALLMTAVTGAWAQTSDKETPLTLQATADGEIRIYDPKDGMKYKVGNDEKQTITGTDYVEIPVTEGQTVQFFGNGTEITAYGDEQGDNYTRFNSNVKCYIYGNIMSLVDEDDFAKATELTGDYAFQLLFSGFRNLSNHASRKLVLPAMTMTKECYYGMFFGSGLTEAPALPAQKLAERCYKNMFYGCSSLTAAPELPATTLKKQCYYGMFQNCTSLTTAPLLPAPELAQQCYNWMFYGCTNLNAVTCLATDISAEYATYGWLNGVAATGTLTIAKGTEDKWAAKSTDDGIPSGWTTDVYGFKVKLAAGTADAANWTATVNGEQPNPLPVAGLNEGDAVTLTYGGRLKVKAVTATTDAKPAGPKAAKDATAEDLGKVIGADGNIYDDADAATAANTTALAKIFYVGSDNGETAPYNHGLALALGDVSGTKNWCSQDEATCLGTGHQFDSEAGAKGDMAGIDNTDALVNNTGHTHDAASAARNYNSGTHPAGTSAWFLPSAGQWDKMATAAGSYANLINNAGLQGGDAAYWSSTEGGTDYAWLFDSSYGNWSTYGKDYDFLVRACLAF